MFYTLVLIIIILFPFFCQKEYFVNDSSLSTINYYYPYSKYIIPVDFAVKSDNLLMFLSDVNSDLQEGQTVSKVHTKNSALDYAFAKQPSDNPQALIDRSILNTAEPIIDDTEDICQHKAATLCTRTDPRMYITSDHIDFPPRWIFPPYSKMLLPMNVNTNCYDEIYNCCKKKF